MPDHPPRMDEATVASRRRGVVRTALILAAIALAIHVAFILSGVLAS